MAVIAAAMALASMIGQWLLTDVVRLREAKRRAAKLRKEAISYPEKSPRRKALLALAAPVQARLTLAAFVPLAVLLGPMVMSFLWLPERIDPAVANPRPGAVATVTAFVDADYAGPVRITSDAALNFASEAMLTTPLRPVLNDLAAQLQNGQISPVLASVAQGKPASVLAQDLRKYLAAGGLPSQTVSWTIPTPSDRAGVYRVTASASEGPAIAANLVTGNAAPPPTAQIDDKGNRYHQVLAPGGPGRGPGPIRELRVRFSDARRQEAKAFFAPFEALGWRYDFGWLGIYLLVYILVLFPARWLLRIP